MRRFSMSFSLAALLSLGLFLATLQPAFAEDTMDDLDAQIEEGSGDKDKAEKDKEKKEVAAAEVEQDAPAFPNLRFYSAAPGGETGLIRVMEAGSGPPLTFRLSLSTGFYTSTSFLKDGDVMQTMGLVDYEQSHIIGRFGLSATVWDFVEVFANLRNSANKNSLSRPQLLQTQGDFELGAKGFYPVLDYLSVGLNFGLTFFNGIGDVTPALDSTGIRTGLLVSFDARGIDKRIPLRLHLNAGMIVENSDALEGGRDLTWIEQYALRINKYHRVALGFAVEAPLPYLDPVGITPFIEFTAEVPVGISADELELGSMGTNTTLADVVPMRLTPGVRVTWLRHLSVDVAVDIGLGGEKAYLSGVPSIPPYTVWLGLTYAFNPFSMGGACAAPETGRIVGKVSKAKDGAPLGNAILTFSQTQVTPVASDGRDGRYVSNQMNEGKVAVTASLEGYESSTHEILVTEGGTAMLDFSLEEAAVEPPKPTGGFVLGRVINALDQMPVGYAVISFDETDLAPMASNDVEGKYGSCEMKPGSYQLTARKEGFLPLTQVVELKAGEKTLQDFALEPSAKQGTLKGVVLSNKDKPLQAKVSIVGQETLELATTADTGAFEAKLPPGDYSIKVEAKGFLSKGRDLKLEENATFSAEFKLSPKPKKVIVVLNIKAKKINVRKKIHFASGKDVLRADAYQILDGVIDILVNHSEVKKLRIEGHTDSKGSRRLNSKLSQGRAEAVMNYLLQQGISAEKLEAKGYGPDKPIAPNTTRRGREQNRRVEFTILDK